VQVFCVRTNRFRGSDKLPGLTRLSLIGVVYSVLFGGIGRLLAEVV
jgi:hypothetical protein